MVALYSGSITDSQLLAATEDPALTVPVRDWLAAADEIEMRELRRREAES